MAQSAYTNGPRGLQFRPGEVFEVNDALFAYLMADAPGVFVEFVPEPPVVAGEPTPKALDAPPMDKAMRAPRAKK